ncbi:MAG: amidohydrolase family protein [Acidobacteriota bacterium]|nr:amidohydrolase family protein [Acidobacteriota bacterium]
MLRHALPVLLTAALWVAGPLASDAQDLVILNGRVMDPESGLDAVRHVAITGGRITAVSDVAPVAPATIDADGLVVAPGFIDLHAHGQDLASNRFQVADGVTTALELEIGTWPVAEYHEARAGDALIHYGATVSHVIARYAAIEGHAGSVGEPGAYRAGAFGSETARSAVSREVVDATLERIAEGLRHGALGVGFGITYTPGATHEEIFRAFAAASELEAPIFVHVRAAARMGGDRLAPLQEVIANAAATGVALHIVHLNSSTDESARPALELIRAARASGIDVTTESYPYTAGSTLIQSALFDDWQGDFANLQWTETGERLTRETFQYYRRGGGTVIIHGRSEETNEWLVAQPDVIVASDGMSFAAGPAHPRGAGTYSRVLGHYVRQREALDLMSALTKMTLLPARRLEAIAPQMKRKGRVQAGADADLVVFDPGEVLDRATYTDSMQPSAGIRHVFVGGTAVIRDGTLVEGVRPGLPIYGRHFQAGPRAARR